MRIRLIPLVLVAAVACKKEAPPAPAQTQARAAAADSSLRGKVVETFDASNYTYVRIETGSGEAWAAVPTAKIAVGQEIAIAGPIWMDNFKSNTLNRSWDRIAFGTLEGGAPAAPRPAGPGMFAAQAAGNGSQAGMPPAHPTAAAPAEVGDVNVAKAKGAEGRRIAEIYAQRNSLKDRRVIVRGKVVKATNGVMGKNWIHLRDGTGKDATADLTIASTDEAGVGQTVTVNGVVHLDRELGAGYHYDVLIEDAQVKAE